MATKARAKRARAAKAPAWVPCTIRQLPPELQPVAAARAAEVNPQNKFSMEGLPADLVKILSPPARLAVLNDKYWGVDGVRLTVGFVENTSPALKAKILKYANRWGESKKHPANIVFVESNTDPQVRISRAPGGYWSYLGTDILSIPKNQPTMNLEGFVLSTSDSEFERVVCHEFGHTLGFPHEHTRPEIVGMLDDGKTIVLFRREQGWTEQEVRQQVLNAMSRGSFKGTPEADPTSIQCYGFPGSITKDGKPIPGGAFINDSDYAFAASIYPPKGAPPKPGTSGWGYIAVFDSKGVEVFRWPSK
jgi:hypothetical protein